ncbi:twin transmembrane helix small protein [Azospirillum sp. RWY-5-1]|uniref:Twin transmembrane helix small protein n=1 Tax=Azospirillum oleiclasticum TaxID=2735135 RepID=A0ABX2TFD1_9PROT|nr:twin transmembrane helix small protein [Azospirillum oleiclasticum]NYZ15637.1 twin transmembrane helix small protein [Azospirillum oleiclasticum]NYZ21907.1 twin transmembrane helix small protein [Azospirillum oleiclasticum]
MSGFFVVLMALAMLAVLASLFLGLFFMARGGAADARNSNRMMRWRVTLQGIALVLFLLAVMSGA